MEMITAAGFQPRQEPTRAIPALAPAVGAEATTGPRLSPRIVTALMLPSPPVTIPVALLLLEPVDEIPAVSHPTRLVAVPVIPQPA